MKKKLVAIISVVAMLMTMFPATVFAEPAAGSDKPVSVNDAESLKQAIKNASGSDTTTIELTGHITVSESIVIESGKKIEIDLGGFQIKAEDSLDKGDASAANVFEIKGNANVTLKNGTIAAGANTKHVVNIFEATVKLDGLTLDRSGAIGGTAGAANGAPLVISGSEVDIKGTLKLIKGDHSWYGMNIDSSSSDKKPSNVTIEKEANVTGDIYVENTKANGATTRPDVNLENHGTVSGNVVLRYPKKGDVSLNNSQGTITGKIAVSDNVIISGAGNNGGITGVDDDGIPSNGTEAVTIDSSGVVKSYNKLADAIAHGEDSTVIVSRNVTVSEKIEIKKSLTLDLNGNTINAIDRLTATGDPNVIDVTGGNVTIKNGTIVAGTGTKHVLNIWKAGKVTLDSLILDHTKSTYVSTKRVKGGAPLVIGGTDVDVTGNLNLVTGPNSWYGMNVDSKKDHPANVEIMSGVTVNGSIKIENTGKNSNETSAITNKGTINGNIEVAGEGSTLTNNLGATIIGKVTDNGGEINNNGTIKDPNGSTGGKPSTPSVTKDRVAGADRFETAIKVADQLKKELGVVKFNNIVVAYSDEFADALSATALAADKDAPILVVNENNESAVKKYISANLNKGGNVYIIGGTSVVSEGFEKSLTGCKVTRLGGADRYETNLAVLKAIGVTGASDIMVASGLKYPDALSASATGNPVILVGKTLTDNQKAYLATLGGNDDYYVIGGTVAVNATVMNQLNASKLGTVTRLGGDTRYETGLAVADEFFTNARNVVIASGDDFPDGLTGGVLANAMNAPLMLVNQYNTDVAADYVDDNSVRTVIAIGGTTVIPDATLNKVA